MPPGLLVATALPSVVVPRNKFIAVAHDVAKSSFDALLTSPTTLEPPVHATEATMLPDDAKKGRRHSIQFKRKMEANIANKEYFIKFSRRRGFDVYARADTNATTSLYHSSMTQESMKNAYLAFCAWDYNIQAFLRYANANNGAIPPLGLPEPPK